MHLPQRTGDIPSVHNIYPLRDADKYTCIYGYTSFFGTKETSHPWDVRVWTDFKAATKKLPKIILRKERAMQDRIQSQNNTHKMISYIIEAVFVGFGTELCVQFADSLPILLGGPLLGLLNKPP